MPRCLKCRDKFTPKKFLAKYCEKSECKEAELEMQKAKVQKPRQPIKKVSDKRQIANVEYYAKRKVYLARPENQKCFIEGCERKANSIEHTIGRWGKNYLDESTWAPCCIQHNLELENNPELSKKYQLSKITGNPKS